MTNEQKEKIRQTLAVSNNGEYVSIKMANGMVTIERVMPTCFDRGNYIVKASSRDNHKLYIDGADMFPRYYFDLEAMITEIEAWIDTRKQCVEKLWSQK